MASQREARARQNQIELTYSRPEIEVLDAQERAKRLEGNKLPDPYGVSQILRGVGALLDNRQAASVLAIDYQDQWVTMIYAKRWAYRGEKAGPRLPL